MLAVIFLKGNKIRFTSIDVLNGNNKCSYLHYKECLSRILINTFYDDVLGWLLLAAYFYSTQEYHKMSHILLFSSQVLSLKKFFASSHADYRGILFGNYNFLNADFPDIKYLGDNQSLALFRFLNFLYSRKQGSSIEVQSALQLLKRTVNKERDSPIHFVWKMTSYDLLHKAIALLNDKEEDNTYILEELKTIKKSNGFDTFMKYAENDVEILKLKLLLDGLL